MVVLSNHRVGPSSELMVSVEVASEMLAAIATAARPLAASRWEAELVRWLEQRASRVGAAFDVGEIAWTPEHFELQREFLIRAAIVAAHSSEHASALRRWTKLVEALPREAVQVGRRWDWAEISS